MISKTKWIKSSMPEKNFHRIETEIHLKALTQIFFIPPNNLGVISNLFSEFLNTHLLADL